jgi:hypothetical protein
LEAGAPVVADAFVVVPAFFVVVTGRLVVGPGPPPNLNCIPNKR